MKETKEFRDLSEEDKVKVIAGSVMAVAIGVAFLVFAQFFLVEDRLHVSSLWAAGMSSFSITRIVLPALYVVIFVPTAIVAGTTVAYLRRRLSALLNAMLILFGVGGYFLIAALLLTLFDVFLSGLPVEMQTPFMVLAFFIPAIMVAWALRVKKINGYLKSL